MPTNEFFYGEICRWGKSSFSHAVDVEGEKEKSVCLSTRCQISYQLNLSLLGLFDLEERKDNIGNENRKYKRLK
jgi:hypothetical protein